MPSLKKLFSPSDKATPLVRDDDREQYVLPPQRPAMSESPPRILVIGAGSRGHSYARAIMSSSNGIVVAVAEPDGYKRDEFGRTMIWGVDKPPAEGAVFRGWRDFIIYEKDRRARVRDGATGVPPGVDAVFVCVLDEMHREVVVALSELGGLHIMCEKPLATTLEDCVELYRALQSNRNAAGEQLVFSIGHVLRYSPHNMMLRKLLLEDRVIGDILSIVHTEVRQALPLIYPRKLCAYLQLRSLSVGGTLPTATSGATGAVKAQVPLVFSPRAATTSMC